MSTTRRLAKISTLLLGLLIVGTCGFVLVEGWPLFDGIYMTIITLSTVGYSETQDLSQTGRLFTSFLILISMFSMACWTAGITSWIVSGDLSGTFHKRKMSKMISKFSKHTIVCSNGLLGRTVIDELIKQNKEVVLITDSELESQFMKRMYPQVPVVQSDPTSEVALADGNILDAGVVVAATESDVDNLMIAITCRGLGTDVIVYCCAHSNEFASRMFKVGADKVICPNELGGKHVANLISEDVPTCEPA